jgi:tetratricopeptide (TPR) repeat protein
VPSSQYTLILAAYGNHIEIVKILIDRGADVNAKNKKGITALTVATRFAYHEIMGILLDKGGDLGVAFPEGGTIFVSPPGAITKEETSLVGDPLVDFVGWFNKGVARTNSKQWKEAIFYFDRALELNPNLWEAWQAKGQALAELGKGEEALSSLARALALNSNEPEVWYAKGIVLTTYPKTSTLAKMS